MFGHFGMIHPLKHPYRSRKPAKMKQRLRDFSEHTHGMPAISLLDKHPLGCWPLACSQERSDATAGPRPPRIDPVAGRGKRRIQYRLCNTRTLRPATGSVIFLSIPAVSAQAPQLQANGRHPKGDALSSVEFEIPCESTNAMDKTLRSEAGLLWVKSKMAHLHPSIRVEFDQGTERHSQ